MYKLLVLNCVLIIFFYNPTICQSQDAGQMISQFLPKEFTNGTLSIDGIKQVLKEKCKKAAGDNSTKYFADIEKEAAVLMACVSNFMNVSAVQEEMAIARPLGELDTVFQKYCNKVPQAERCLNTFAEKVQMCLTVKEQQQNHVLLRMIKGLANFGCARGGGTIALFIAEDGPECFEANKQAISQCANSSFAEFLPSIKSHNASELFNLPELVLSPEHCVDLEHFEKCTLHHLEQCREVTPANIVESVFKYIKNETNCKSWLQAQASPQRMVLKDASSTSGLQFSWILLAITSLYTILVHIID